ncbi:superoxide dismutase family protein [Aquifex aeolicus]|uniref:Superoxide dismutase [Cu-Zn] 2 n=1 Tax=Aquifex aeolicus (strain VF5) TaxID=224324 RepID=SODC2_AQUAE|nr:superoxide dismutase family protein [Aquifex aeolicus]O66602.1 RecName: Full=Superoxide dismutase [Cu-Zn] 2; Flags: Precursor [Aquifex aeolicus VF5]AAC06553.1 superoxide dismutase (Cu/Zn) [Aquifex aeolicus VF5]
MKKLSGVLAGSLLLISASFSQDLKAHAELINTEGEVIGKAELIETNSGVLIKLNAKGLPPNAELAFHIHERGECKPPTFKSAKGHFNPYGKKHGLLNPEGPHAGDMPNIYTDDKGNVRVQVLNPFVTLKKGEKNSLFKEGGTALVIHSGPDDYKSDPAGNAGKRIACGVIR